MKYYRFDYAIETKWVNGEYAETKNKTASINIPIDMPIVEMELLVDMLIRVADKACDKEKDKEV